MFKDSSLNSVAKCLRQHAVENRRFSQSIGQRPMLVIARLGILPTQPLRSSVHELPPVYRRRKASSRTGPPLFTKWPRQKWPKKGLTARKVLALARGALETNNAKAGLGYRSPPKRGLNDRKNLPLAPSLPRDLNPTQICVNLRNLRTKKHFSIAPPQPL
jgi:hypothetical protein